MSLKIQIKQSLLSSKVSSSHKIPSYQTNKTKVILVTAGKKKKLYNSYTLKTLIYIQKNEDLLLGA